MDFQDAVALATRELVLLKDLPNEAEKLALVIVAMSESGDTQFLQTVIDASQSQALSWDALRLAAADFLRWNSLPPVLGRWLSDELEGLRPRPAVPRRFRTGWPGATETRNLLLHAVVGLLLAKGLTLTRNDTSAASSASDAVAVAMGHLRERPASHKEIAEIYRSLEARSRAGHDPKLSVAVISQLILDTRGR